MSKSAPITFYLLTIATLCTALATIPMEAFPSQKTEPSIATEHTDLTLDNIGALWNARLRAACEIMGEDITEPQQRCLAMALQTLELSLSHFQTQESPTSPLQTLEQLDTLLQSEPNSLGQQQAINHLRSLAKRVPIHPLCLDGLGLTWFDGGDLKDGFLVCDPTDPTRIGLGELEGKLTVWATRPTPPDMPGALGNIVYQFQTDQNSDDGDTYYFDIQTNTGGTGIFASIWVLHQAHFLNVFEPLFHKLGGDRCNDGNLRVVSIFDDGHISYSQNATPFRLFNPYDDGDQRMAFILNKYAEDDDDKLEMPATFMDWAAYSDVNNCAICCVGELYTRLDSTTSEEELFAISIDNETTVEDLFNNPALVECAQEWFSGLANHETNLIPPEAKFMIFKIEDWLGRMEDLKQACGDVSLNQEP